jgi:hypothetical protein
MSGDSPYSSSSAMISAAKVVSALDRSSETFLLNDSYGEVLVEDENEDDEEDDEDSVASRARGRVGGVWIPKINKPENESNPYSNSMGSNDEQEEVSQQRQRNRVQSSFNSSPFFGAGGASSRLRVSTDGETTCATPPLVAVDPSSSSSSSSLPFASISPLSSLPALDRPFLSSRHPSSIPPSQSSDSAFSSHSHSHSPLSTSTSSSSSSSPFFPHDSGTTMPHRPSLHQSSTPHSFQPPPSHLFWNEQFQQLVERIDDIDDRGSYSEVIDKDDDCCDLKKKDKGEDSEGSKNGKSEKEREREGDDISLKIELQRELERYKQLRRLASDFVDVAEKYGTVIISEYHLPTNLKTIKPAVELKGIAGGSKCK